MVAYYQKSCSFSNRFLSFYFCLRFREVRCHRLSNSKRKWRGNFRSVPLKDPSTRTVVLKKEALGQGRERYAFQLYEVGKKGKVLGTPMVAKMGKQVGETGKRSSFIRRHVRTQQFTRRIAKEFNSKINRIKRVGNTTPRMEVLDCWIYHLGKSMTVLAEPRLDHLKWTKWNSNNGVSCLALNCSLRTMISQFLPAYFKGCPGCRTVPKEQNSPRRGHEETLRGRSPSFS